MRLTSPHWLTVIITVIPQVSFIIPYLSQGLELIIGFKVFDEVMA